MMIENKKESLWYVLATFGLTVSCWGLLVVLDWKVKENGTTLSNVLYMLGGMSPAIVALLLPLFMKKGRRSCYYKRYFKFKVSLKWYILSILSVTAMVGLSFGFMHIFFKDATASLSIKPAYMLIPLTLGMVLGGGVEELGWRGILVHNLRKCSPVIISLAVGSIWLLWHIPLCFIPGTSQYHSHFIPFALFVVSISLITTILYVKTKSVVPCLIAHALLNAFGDLGIYFGQSQPSASIAYNLMLLLTGIIAFAIISKVKAGSEQLQQ